MYVPATFELTDPALVRELMRRNPFATLVTNHEDGPFATQIPVLVEDGEPLVLAAHVSRANPHWRLFNSPEDTLVIFHGPHAYISPRLYVSRGSVPTWNYGTVHCYGRPELVEDPEEALRHVQAMTRVFDAELSIERPDSADETMLRRMLPGIVAFRMTVQRFQAKIKLNQNKSDGDRDAVMATLLESTDPLARHVGLLMKLTQVG